MMLYLASTSKGKFIVNGDNWVKACEALRWASAVPADESPVMITAFAPSGDVQKAMTNFTAVDAEKMAAAVASYANSCVDLSWLGSRDAESHEDIRRELAHAKKEVETLIGKNLPE